MTAPLRWLLRAFAALALVAGFLLLPLAERTEDWFSWTIQPPLTAAFLGAAYWAAFALLAWSTLPGTGARARTWREASTAIPPVALIAAGLLVATLIHFERFHRDLFGWFWLVAYLVVPPALAVAVLVERRSAASRPPAPPGPPLPTPLRGLLAVHALVLVPVGVSLLLERGEPWPWPLTPLTSMVVGAFVAGFGVAAAHAVVANDLARFRGAAIAYLVLGVLVLVALAIFGEALDAGAAGVAAYVAFPASAAAAGAAGLAAYRSASAARAASTS